MTAHRLTQPNIEPPSIHPHPGTSSVTPHSTIGLHPGHATTVQVHYNPIRTHTNYTHTPHLTAHRYVCASLSCTMRLLVLALAFALLHNVCAAPSVSVYSTVPLNTSVRLSPQASLTLTDSCPSGLPGVTVSSEQQQPFLGFGAALTETTAYNFARLKQRNLTAYTELLDSLFAPYPTGIAISFLRVPITSCDLSLPTPGWSYDDTPGDINLQYFNTSHGEAYQIPVLQDIMALSKKYNTELRLLGSPWSAPSWIKDSQAWGHGTILDQYYDFYAAYFVLLIQTFDKLGLPLYAITLQNEPRFEPYSYPGTKLTPQNESALANILKPLLRAKNISTLVAAYDHNCATTSTLTAAMRPSDYSLSLLYSANWSWLCVSLCFVVCQGIWFSILWT